MKTWQEGRLCRDLPGSADMDTPRATQSPPRACRAFDPRIRAHTYCIEAAFAAQARSYALAVATGKRYAVLLRMRIEEGTTSLFKSRERYDWIHDETDQSQFEVGVGLELQLQVRLVVLC